MHCLPLRCWVWERDRSGCRDWSGAHFIGSTQCGAAECQLVGAVEEERRRRSLALQVAGSPRPHGETWAEQAATRSVTWISPGTPWDSIRLAVFTVSPQRS